MAAGNHAPYSQFSCAGNKTLMYASYANRKSICVGFIHTTDPSDEFFLAERLLLHFQEGVVLAKLQRLKLF